MQTLFTDYRQRLATSVFRAHVSLLGTKVLLLLLWRPIFP